MTKRLHWLVSLIFVLGVQALHAGTRVEVGYYVEESRERALEVLGNYKDYTIDHVTKNGFEIYGPVGLAEYLKGLKFHPLPSARTLREVKGYPSFSEVENILRTMAQAYPNQSRLFSIGKSVEGRDLWVMKISSSPNAEPALPEVKLIANMHGDEITGREVMLRFIKYLLSSYANNSQIKTLIDNTEIYIMPSMNPDGAEARHRGNAKWVDLNRDFPDFTTEDHVNWYGFRAPETEAVMKWQQSRNFALSANFHGGAEVVNYMWDTMPEDHPLLKLLKSMSLDYANAVPYLKSSTEFENGITNGYHWYEVNGGMQDWSYFWHNDLQFTIELSQMKWPSYSEMDSFFEANREALVRFLYKVHQGTGFELNESGIQGAVEITDLNSGATVGTYAFVNSRFYKVLEPGKYHFKIRAVGGGEIEADFEVPETKASVFHSRLGELHRLNLTSSQKARSGY